MGANSDVEDQKNDDDKSAVPMDTEDNESPSQPDDSDTKSEEPDNSISTLHHIGVAYGYDNDDVYIPTSAEVSQMIMNLNRYLLVLMLIIRSSFLLRLYIALH